MSLAVEVVLPEGRYEAGDVEDRGRVEWPPHPGRLHAALRASSCTNLHDQVLRWLETLPPPQVWAPLTHAGQREHSQFVVTGKVTIGGGSQTHPGRVHQQRRRTSAFVPQSGFAFVWPDIDADVELRRGLADLARRVPYWGRSSSPVLCSVPEQIELRDGWVRFAPTEPGEPGPHPLRVPFPGLTDELERRYESGQWAWEAWDASGWRHYRPVDVEEPQDTVVPVESGHGPMMVFTAPPGVGVDGLHAGALVAGMRSVVMARVPDPLPPEVSGHGANGRPHLAYVPLLDTGHPRARGHVLGAAVLFPRHNRELQAVVAAALRAEQRPIHVSLGGISVALSPADLSLVRSPRLRPGWWDRPASLWATVTPLVLDRFSGRGNEEDEIARHCALLGLPEPCSILTSRSPLIPGGARMSRRNLARPEDRRPFTHARLEFPVPVTGPLVLGTQRHVGMGLCAPLTEGEQPS
ncbi:type I-U CRISPR-associated protein Csb2 [Saccharopolyspora sp. NPDC050389]|uniref:type I-G CRISPR-associated protein Csb2 n=1 Tax=Saccharopolyspora sp. NPDC050389 TaxID=3155516 RepID=UPI0033EAC1CC